MAILNRRRSQTSIIGLSALFIVSLIPLIFLDWQIVNTGIKLTFLWGLFVNEVSVLVLITLLLFRAQRKYKVFPWSQAIRMIIGLGVLIFALEFLLLAYISLNPSR